MHLLFSATARSEWHWTGYEAFSVISGLIMIIGSMVPGLTPGRRIGLFIVGLCFAGYGIYVARQATGLYFFPVEIFVIPVVAIVYVIAAAITRQSPADPWPPRVDVDALVAAAHLPPQRIGTDQPTPPARQVDKHLAEGTPVVSYCTNCGAGASYGDRFCTQCGSGL
jgi:hypothetical protein